jgi:hypothetical protein
MPLTFGLALSGRGETSRTRLGQPLAAQKKNVRPYSVRKRKIGREIPFF